MSAISTVLMEFTQPGDVLLYSLPVYGGTDHFIKHILTKYQVEVVPFSSHDSKQDIIDRVDQSNKEKFVKHLDPRPPNSEGCGFLSIFAIFVESNSAKTIK